MAPWRRARCGLSRTFQISRVFSNLTVWGNVMLAATGVNGLSGRSFLPANSDPSTVAWVDRLLDQWGLSSLKLTPVQQLSYGSQRLLEIALALATHPRVVLLDEPTAGLSSAERIMVTNRLVQLDRAVTMILTDHDMDVVFQVADRITVLNYGEVIADGDTKSVRADPRVREIYLGGS
jgi:branched-chain amino acid transport system ATP-binding protein